MVTKKEWVTAQELMELPDDGYRYELVRGELRKMPPSSGEHGIRAGRLIVRLGAYVLDNNLGEVVAAEGGYLLESNPDHVRAPDASFLRRERVEALGTTRGFIPGAPDLAIEVLSPSNRPGSMAEKVADYLAAGSQMVVVVDPDARTLTVHRPHQSPQTLTEADTLEGGEVVPGWQMPVAEVFG